MRTYAAELYIYHPSLEIKKKRLSDLFDKISQLKNQTWGNLYDTRIVRDNIEEEWFEIKEFSNAFCTVVCCDIHNLNYNYNVCLEQQFNFIKLLVKNKFIDSSYLQIGLPNEKKRFLFSKFENPKLIGYGFGVFLRIIQIHYLYTKTLKELHENNIKELLKKYWGSLSLDNEKFDIQRNQYDKFLNDINTPFSKEIMDVIKT